MSGYIGTQPVPQATQTRDVFTATSGQTTFATSGYTPNFLDCWLNGVKLVNGDDFTATNGSDVVLASGATTGDTVEVLSYSTFEVADRNFTGDTSAENFTVTGTFTSRGIDDNATSTAVTLDASGNVLVGKTSDSFGTVGSSYRVNGSISATASSNEVLDLNRLSTDGNIMRFFKDGTTVGSIQSRSGLVTTMIFDPRASGAGITGGGPVLYPTNNTGALTNNLVSLGDPTYNFKNLYLSGGVYLGGTGAANLLDDYEEGTWTPVLTATASNPTVSYSAALGNYIKVGQFVLARVAVSATITGAGSGSLKITLPFLGASLNTNYQHQMVGYYNPNSAQAIGMLGVTFGSADAVLYGSQTASGTNAAIIGPVNFATQIVYIANA